MSVSNSLLFIKTACVANNKANNEYAKLHSPSSTSSQYPPSASRSASFSASRTLRCISRYSFSQLNSQPSNSYEDEVDVAKKIAYSNHLSKRREMKYQIIAAPAQEVRHRT